MDGATRELALAESLHAVLMVVVVFAVAAAAVVVGVELF